MLSCGESPTAPGVSPPPAPPVAPPPRTSVEVRPATATLLAFGDTVRMAAEVRDENGQVLSGAVVSWSSSDSLVATVDTTGLVTAAGNGTAGIWAGTESAAGSGNVTVTQEVRGVRVSPAAITIATGASLRLSADAIDANGHRVERPTTFVWTSSNVDVARVSESGRVTGVADGRATISAMAEDHGASAEIRVATADRAALVAFYEATDGPNWANNDNWLTDAPLNDWHGVSTDGSGRVVALALGGRRDDEAGSWIPHGLKGRIPAAIGALSSLRRLELRVNALTGPLPPEIGSLPNLTHLDLWSNDLTGPIPPEIGRLANLTYLGLASNALSGSLPPEIGDLSRLTRLDLYRNALSGAVPHEIGNLSRLEFLTLRRNALTGPLPRSFLGLAQLDRLDLSRNEGLCVPGTVAFDAWLAEIEDRRVSFCNADDLAVLTALYDATDGVNWVESAGWLDGVTVERWHGVSADSLGRVTALDLARNGLSGPLPPNLGLLSQLKRLRVGGNALSGRLPSSLSGLGLLELDYAETGLCVPSNSAFRAWLNAIPSHAGTGVECAPPSDRDVLELFYAATNGPNWTHKDSWLTDAPLGEWYGVETDDGGRVTRLHLRGNNLRGGPLLAELGDLSGLTSLGLAYNELSGPLPPEIGNLSNVAWLDLSGNALSGAIPPEIGNLSSIRFLHLRENALSGPLPPEIGSLPRLRRLGLGHNDLSGPVPQAFGGLSTLDRLDLRDNAFTGALPRSFLQLEQLDRLLLSENESLCVPGSSAFVAWLEGIEERDVAACNAADMAALAALYEATDGPRWIESGGWLGNGAVEGWHGVTADTLGHVTELDLARNGLSGALPPSLGRLARMTRLRIGGNALSGPLPSSLAGLGLVEFDYSDTGLCVPAGAAFHEWLNAIRTHGGTDVECAPLSDREILASFHEATGGRDWANRDNWLTDAPLRDWAGVEVDAGGHVTGLRLGQNGLRGALPAALGGLSSLKVLDLRNNALRGAIPPDLGDLSNLTELEFGYNVLSGRLPPELGNLAKLTTLNLPGNALGGPIPPELGNLSDLTGLDVWGNALTGSVPRSFLQLGQLDRLVLSGNALLCVPGSAPFAAWLDGIEERDVLACNASDVDVLASLYDATGGPSWLESGGWLGGDPVEQWHGVTADSLGRVTGLDLTRNRLSGRLPLSLGRLTRMTRLRVGGNALYGPLPSTLPGLGLVEFDYSGTALCVPGAAAFHEWLNAIPSHGGTEIECPSDRDILESFYHATGGANWESNENWLTDAPLGEWHGVEVDGQGNVVELDLAHTGLRGRIPPELGDLAGLQALRLPWNDLGGRIPPELSNLLELRALALYQNDLRGPIPPQLGSLAGLESLDVESNDLTGPIPSELGDLADLRSLNLNGNGLTGRIPPELGDLRRLRFLSLGRNSLAGPIPFELGRLPDLQRLDLTANGLTGPVPSNLGDLSALETLALGDNLLTGPVPSELGGLMRLRTLALQRNAGLSGILPASLTSLEDLETLQTEGTGLCTPSDTDFLEWLGGVPNRRVARCDFVPPAAYLVQAVQSREFPVPLVAGEPALLRVFPTASRTTSQGLPPVEARFYVDGREAHVARIAGTSVPIPTEVDEGSLSKSANAVIPAHVVRPGLEMVIDVDPNGTLDSGLGVVGRIPETGRLAVDVHATPPFELTLIPFVWSENPDRSIVGLTRDMAANPDRHELLAEARTLLPIVDQRVTAHEPVMSSTNNGHTLLQETIAIRTIEGGTGYYMGMMSGPITGRIGGVASGWSNFSMPHPRVIAHELGHNLSLPHAPCGGAAGVDPGFPTRNGSIGVWGYDFRAGSGLVDPGTPDVMSYCDPHWISDYFFAKALGFRMREEQRAAQPDRVPRTRSLLMWGGVDADGVPFLEPAFVLDALPSPPNSGGPYTLAGHSADGGELFSMRLEMPETADGDGRSAFVFALPAPFGWEDDLAAITLSGPGGSATLDRATDRPMAILRDPRTGQVRGFLRDLPPTAQAAMAAARDAAAPDLEIIFSCGIPCAQGSRP